MYYHINVNISVHFMRRYIQFSKQLAGSYSIALKIYRQWGKVNNYAFFACKDNRHDTEHNSMGMVDLQTKIIHK